jgi:hypothetical protein
MFALVMDELATVVVAKLLGPVKLFASLNKVEDALLPLLPPLPSVSKPVESVLTKLLDKLVVASDGIFTGLEVACVVIVPVGDVYTNGEIGVTVVPPKTFSATGKCKMLLASMKIGDRNCRSEKSIFLLI